ncbi:hypothetical protein HDU80_003148 [Chytriomyces hyalinus]|nr:hypothetical protein HDU80_003148 [Chytriomyces hyalinus]
MQRDGMSHAQNTHAGASSSCALSDEDHEAEQRNDDQADEEHSNGPGDEAGAGDAVRRAGASTHTVIQQAPPLPAYGNAQDHAETLAETGRSSRAASVTASGMTRNTYTIDMKIKVAERGLEKGRNIAAKEYGLNGSMVGRWMRSIETMRQTIAASDEAAEQFGCASASSVQTKRRRLPDGITMVTGGRKDPSAAQAKLKRRNTNDQGDVKEETVSTAGSTPQQSISHEFPSQHEVSTTTSLDLKGKARLLGVQPVTLSDHQTRQYASQRQLSHSSLPTSLPITSHTAEGSVPDPLMMNLYFSNSNPMNSPINYQGVFHLPPQQSQQQLQYSTSIQPHNPQSMPNQQQQQQSQQQQPPPPPTPTSHQQQQQTSLQTDFFMQQQPLSLNSTSSSHFLSTQGSSSSGNVTPFHTQPQLTTSQPLSEATLHNTTPVVSGANTASKMGVSIALSGLKNALDVYNDDASLDDPHWKELVPLLKDTRLIKPQARHLSYFRAHPKPSTRSAAASSRASTNTTTTTTTTPDNTTKTQTNDSSSSSFKPPKDPMANFSESEVKQIKREIEDQGRRAFNFGYAIIGGGMAVVLGFVGYKQLQK